MIIFLYGQDSYRIGQKLQEIVNGYKIKNPSGLNLIKLDFAENNINDFYDAIKSDSFIPEKKLVIVKNIFRADSEIILEFLKTKDFNKREDTILIAVSFSDTGGGKLFEYLTGKPNQVQNFKLLKEYEIKNWVKKSLNAMGVEIAGDAMDFLVSNCGLDLWRLSNEIKKLADFSAQGGSPEGRKIKVIVKSQVEELIVGSREHNIFELTDALAKKNKIKALSALHKALDGGEKPTELLGLLAWQVRNILRFKLSSKLSELKLHPFVLGKIKESAEYFSAAELNVILSKIIDLDLAFKTTDLNEKTALSLLISEL